MDVLEQLTDQHREIEAMVAVLAATEPGTGREQLVERVDAALRLHMTVEERFVYEIVEDYLGEDAFTGGENEHDLARAGLIQLRELVDEPGFGAAVAGLHGTLRHHALEEEYAVFLVLRATPGAPVALSRLRDLGELEALVLRDDALLSSARQERWRPAFSLR